MNMRIILLGILIFCSTISKGIESDKIKHVIAGGAINVATTGVVYAFTKDKKAAILSGVAASILVSAGKELIYDKAMKRGTPETMDFVAGCIGVSLTLPITLLLK